MKEVNFETVFTAEEISERINKLIDSESIFDLNEINKPFRGFCNICKFDMQYPNLSRKADYFPKYTIQGSITDNGNTRKVYFIVRKSLASYFALFFLFIVLIAAVLNNQQSAVMQLIYLAAGLTAYAIYTKFSLKKHKKAEDEISEMLIKSILSN